MMTSRSFQMTAAMEERGCFKLKSTYKWCYIPLCKNTTASTPSKVFVSVPKDLKRRKLWLKAARRDYKSTLTSSLYCCEDHFNMEEDMENYLRFKMMGGMLKSKPNTVPHIFECQPQRPSSKKIERHAAHRRNAMHLLSDAMSVTAATASSASQAVEVDQFYDSTSGELEISAVQSTTDDPPAVKPLSPQFRDLGIQAKPRFRSVSTSCNAATLGTHMNAQTSPLKRRCFDVSLSPIKVPYLKRQKLSVENIYTDSSASESDSDEQISSEESTSSSEYVSSGGDGNVDSKEKKACDKLANLNVFRLNASNNPRRYLGLPEDSIYVLDALCDHIDYKSGWLSKKDVVTLVLRKVRLNESFAILGELMGITTWHATRLFSQHVVVIAECMNQLIIWPTQESIHRLLPLAFRSRYSNVESIIDCFEIEIEKPSKALHQALTWSDYKKANTLKYLVSGTPDGIVNFVSTGYGGRVSDMILLETSGYIDKLKEGMGVMADRGFKHVENAIRGKKCTFIRPPSVSTGTKLSASECKETKRIASLRIHIERLIRRFREFKMLTPHACVNIHMVSKVDHCVVIAAGLINLQGSIIK